MRRISLRTPRRKSQAALHGESLRRQSGRPDHPRQAVLLLRFRMGSDRAADRQCHDSADAGISGLCPAATAARRSGLRNRIDLSAGAAAGAVLQEALFAVRQHRGNSARGSGLPVQQRWERCGRQSAEWKRLREPPEHFAFERRSASRCRRLASTTTSMRRTWPGSGFRPTPDCRRPTPIRSIRYSTPSLRSRSTHSHRATRMCSPGTW